MYVWLWLKHREKKKNIKTKRQHKTCVSLINIPFNESTREREPSVCPFW